MEQPQNYIFFTERQALTCFLEEVSDYALQKAAWTVSVLLARYRPPGEQYFYELQNQLAFPWWSSLSG